MGDSISKDGPAVLPLLPEGILISNSPRGRIIPVITSMPAFITFERRRLPVGIKPKCCTINCVIATAGAFILFTCINRPCKLVTDVSKMSYGMYLMHIFWLGLWVEVYKNTLALPTVAAIPAIAITTYAASYATTKLISLIPGSKWLVGC